MSKDLFSNQAKKYSLYRPTYPLELYKQIYKIIIENQILLNTAWDCGTGNGQVAVELSKKFNLVYATDISEKQLKYAKKIKNIKYQIEEAENTSFKENTFDLITVAQALHWFRIQEFFKEVYRVGKKPSLICIWCYSTLEFLDKSNPIQDLFLNFYNQTLGEYWEPERKLVENGYKDINFPFSRLQKKIFYLNVEWDRNQFFGYLRSWSSVEKYKKIHKKDPVIFLEKEIEPIWDLQIKKNIRFPIFFISGIIDS